MATPTPGVESAVSVNAGTFVCIDAPDLGDVELAVGRCIIAPAYVTRREARDLAPLSVAENHEFLQFGVHGVPPSIDVKLTRILEVLIMKASR